MPFCLMSNLTSRSKILVTFVLDLVWPYPIWVHFLLQGGLDCTFFSYTTNTFDIWFGLDTTCKIL